MPPNGLPCSTEYMYHHDSLVQGSEELIQLIAIQPGDDRPRAGRTVAPGHFVGERSQGRLAFAWSSCQRQSCIQVSFRLIRQPEAPSESRSVTAWLA